MSATQTWEQSVLWLRDQPDRQELVRACYYDDPLPSVAERFRQSEEWTATAELLRRWIPGRVLDLGAGRGIASYALAREGCQVVALEPDASDVVGRGAIRKLAADTGMPIEAVDGLGEAIPFPDNTFDAVYGRAVLHHARELPALCREVARVLRPGGAALWVREHVISVPADLPKFLDAHPLHRLYGGENAFLLEDYCSAIRDAGLTMHQLVGPLENAANYFPASQKQVRDMTMSCLVKRLGRPLAHLAMLVPASRRWCIHRVSRKLDHPGRHYAFLGVKE